MKSNSATEIPSPRRILLILLRNIGDVVLTTPAVRVLKNRFPEAEIDFVTNSAPAELLTNNPHLNDALVYPYKPNDVAGALKFSFKLYKNKYDISVDFLGTPATALMSFSSRAPIRVGFNLRFRKYAYTHYDQDYRGGIYNALTKFTLLKPLGIQEEESGTEIFVKEEARNWADQLFKEREWTDQSVVAMATCAINPVRRWLPERFAEVARWLQSNNHPVILLWGPGEREYVQAVQNLMDTAAVLSPPTSLMQLAALLERCRLLVCNCSGTKHIAVAVGTPTMTIHGPSEPGVWTPPDDSRHTYVRAEGVDCLGCGEKECDDLICMEKVSPQEVIDAIEKMDVLP